MRRRVRRSPSGTFSADVMSPLFRMGAFLVVLVLVYSWARNPQSWRWLENDAPPAQTANGADKDLVAGPDRQDAGKKSAPAETIVPGPTELDPAEAAAARNLFQALSDRAPLANIEMPAYWRCLKWARAQSFAELDRRALRRIVYTQLWEDPDKYRGKLIELRLHIRRVLSWQAPENSAGVHTVYEAWGWTDESKSFPYVVVTTDVPKDLPLGDNLHEEGLFVGYFLKTIGYTASNRNRSSPLLLGRMKWLPSAGPARPLVSQSDWSWIAVIGISAVVLIALGAWLNRRRVRHVKLPAAPADDAEMEDWFRNGSATTSGTTESNGPTNDPRG
jgi:hypothetical protein